MPDQDFHQTSSFRIKNDDHAWLFTNKLVSDASSKSAINAAASSFRVYYGDVSGAVPFTWEARPGTPKHTFSHGNNTTPIPIPLTPPPSYYANSLPNYSKKQHYSRSKLQLLHTLFRRMNPNSKCKAPPRSYTTSSSPSWSSSSNSLCSDPTMTPPIYTHGRQRRFSSWGSSFDDQYRGTDQVGCPSRFCFGIRG